MARLECVSGVRARIAFTCRIDVRLYRYCAREESVNGLAHVCLPKEESNRRLHAHARARESMQAVAAVATMGALALRAGEPAPDFSVVSHTGATVKLSDYAGKKVVLWFYPRASTGG